MIDHWIGHYHRGPDTVVSRLPASLKLGVALAIIAGTVLAPPRAAGWYLAVAAALAGAVILSRMPMRFLLKRLAWLSPLVLGVAVANVFQPGGRGTWPTVAVKSMLCLATIITVSNTTPFSHILRVLRAVRVPALLITTLALMHRYLFVLAEEAERMRRARTSRLFTRPRRARWRLLSTVVGQLFVRASERAERIYGAMCARGWK